MRVDTTLESQVHDTTEDMAAREASGWDWWLNASDTDRMLMVRTITSELQRLMIEPEAWLPGAIDARNPQELRIVIRIRADELGEDVGLLPVETDMADAAISRMERRLNED